MKYQGLRYVELLRLREELFEFFTLEESLEAVKKNGYMLSFVKHQTPEICLEAVRDTGVALMDVHNQTEEICLEAYKQYPYSVKYIKIDIKDEILRKVKEDSYRYFTEEESLKAVNEDGHNLVYVKHQTEEICLNAVRENGNALMYVINQTEEICLEAYKQNIGSIEYIRDTLEDYRKRRLNLIKYIYS